MTGENHYATASRRKILEILKESKDKTVTAAQIGEQLRQMDSEVNITTIYRYLDRLEKDGTVIRYVSGQGSQAAYQYVEQGKCIVDATRLVRRLIPLECERLMGFPDYWTDIPRASDSARYRALGNSVAVPCVDFILCGIAMYLSKMGEEEEDVYLSR